MLLSLFFVLFLASCFYALTRDAGATTGIVIIGFLQDPARKLMAGEPVYMSILVGFIVLSVLVRRVLVHHQSFTEPFSRWSTELDAPLKIYLLLVFIQGVHAYVRHGSLFLPLLGAIFYIAPLLAIIVGYSQFNAFKVVRWFLLLCSCFALLTAATVLMSFLGVENQLFGEVGAGLIIYDQGTILKAYSGLLRSSEIAAWHMGAAVCFLIVLISDRGRLSTVLIVAVSVILLIAAIILTGRRKMILQILIFSSIFVPLLQFYQGRLSVRFGMLFVFAAGLLWFFATWYVPSVGGYDLYYARGASVFSDAGERFSSLGLGSIQWAFNEHGWFGSGLGVAAQGAQHFSSRAVISGSGEGGIGKLVSELGLISLIFIAWFVFAVARHLHKCLALVSSVTPSRLSLAVGVGAFIAANVPTFMVASQVYGDVFVLLVLGLLSGSLFAIPKLVSTELARQAPRGSTKMAIA